MIHPSNMDLIISDKQYPSELVMAALLTIKKSSSLGSISRICTKCVTWLMAIDVHWDIKSHLGTVAEALCQEIMLAVTNVWI